MKIKKSILAGIIVTIVAYNYLLNHDLLSKILFSVALIVILTMNLNLFTSKAAIILWSDDPFPSRIKDTAIIFFGNALTCIVLGVLFSLIGETHAGEIWEAKLQTGALVVLYKAILVGFLMQFAANCKHDFVTIGAVLLFLGISGEHSIANIAYASIGGMFSFQILIHIIISIIGNVIGGSIIHLLNRDGKILDFSK